VSRIAVGNIAVDYQSIGEGPPVVLIHGLACGQRMWFRQVRRLQHRYRVITYDQRGHGLTDAPDDPKRYSGDHLTRDLVGLLDVLKLDKVALVGFSMGGGPALSLAAQMPERVSRLVLADVGAGANDSWKLQWLARRWRTLLDREGLDALVADMLRSDFYKTYANCGARYRRHMAGLIRATPVAGLRHSFTEVLAKRKSLLRSREFVKAISVPTLVLVGKRGYVCRHAARVLADNIPGAVLKKIAGAGHMSPLEAPGEFSAAVLEFVSE
jgi:3-oxoadipate enol-lactonase